LASADPPGCARESVFVEGVSDTPCHPNDTVVSGKLLELCGNHE